MNKFFKSLSLALLVNLSIGYVAMFPQAKNLAETRHIPVEYKDLNLSAGEEQVIETVESITKSELLLHYLVEFVLCEWSSTGAAISLTTKTAYNALETALERTAALGMLKMTSDGKVQLLPDGQKLIKESLNKRMGSDFLESGYNKILVTLIGEEQYKKCLAEYKKAIIEFYKKFVKKNQLQGYQLVEEFEEFEGTDPEAFFNVIMMQVNGVNELIGRDIDTLELKYEMLYYLEEKGKTLSKLIEPYINKKKLAAILLSGAAVGTAFHYGIKTFFQKFFPYTGDEANLRSAINLLQHEYSNTHSIKELKQKLEVGINEKDGILDTINSFFYKIKLRTKPLSKTEKTEKSIQEKEDIIKEKYVELNKILDSYLSDEKKIEELQAKLESNDNRWWDGIKNLFSKIGLLESTAEEITKLQNKIDNDPLLNSKAIRQRHAAFRSFFDKQSLLLDQGKEVAKKKLLMELKEQLIDEQKKDNNIIESFFIKMKLMDSVEEKIKKLEDKISNLKVTLPDQPFEEIRKACDQEETNLKEKFSEIEEKLTICPRSSYGWEAPKDTRFAIKNLQSNAALKISTANKLLPSSSNSSGLYLWKNLIGISEPAIAALQTGISLGMTAYNTSDIMKTFFSGEENSITSTSPAFKAFILLPIFGITAFSLYNGAKDLYTQYKVAKKHQVFKPVNDKIKTLRSWWTQEPMAQPA